MNEENPELQTWIDPELEARVVASVLGEASPFEVAEIERIIAEKPELGVFKRRIEAVHGLVAPAVKTETNPMRLDDERRRKLLERLGGEKAPGAPEVVAMPQEKPAGERRTIWRTLGNIAACLAILGLLASISMPSYRGVQTRAAATRMLVAQREAKLAGMAKDDAEIAPSAAAPFPTPQVSSVQAILPPPVPPNRLAALDALKDWDKAPNSVGAGGKPAVESDYFGATANAPGAPEPNVPASPAEATGPNPEAHEYQDTGSISHQMADAQISRLPVSPAQSQILASSLPATNAPDTPGEGAAPGEAGGGEPGLEAAVTTPTVNVRSANTYAGATTVSGGVLVKSKPEATGNGGVPESINGTLASNEANADGSASATGKQTEEVPALGDIPVLGRAFRSQQAPQGATAHVAMTDVSRGAGSAGLVKYGSPITTVNPASLGLSLDAPVVPAPQTDETSAADQPYSTFSLHVSDVSFLLARQTLLRGQLPDAESIRPEEFYNAFDYGDPAPAAGERIACRIEQAAHPVVQQRNLVRIAMKVAATGRGAGQPLRLTVLLDTSGSMEREDRAASVLRAMQALASLLGPDDAVTLIGFARQPRLLAEEVPGDQAARLVDIAAHTPAEGGTNMEEAVKLAGELALRHFAAGGQNRVVMLTDGAANLGDANPAQLAHQVEQLRQKGVSFDACGVGADGLNDSILEAITRKGGGRYYLLNGPDDADQGFARQLAGAFRPAAENVKMQVRFNSARVGKYRLIGFEKHRLNQEDFRNDKVTAAQLAAEEAAVALYQVQVLPEGEGEIGEVFVRFRDPADGRMIEQSWTIPYDGQAPALDKATPSMQLAATASLLAEKLRGGPMADALDLDALAPVVAQMRGSYAGQERVQWLVQMYEQTRGMLQGRQPGSAK